MEVSVNLLSADKTGLPVVVTVGVRVIKDVREPLYVSVLFGEDDVLLLFLDDAVTLLV